MYYTASTGVLQEVLIGFCTVRAVNFPKNLPVSVEFHGQSAPNPSQPVRTGAGRHPARAFAVLPHSKNLCILLGKAVLYYIKWFLSRVPRRAPPLFFPGRCGRACVKNISYRRSEQAAAKGCRRRAVREKRSDIKRAAAPD